HVMDLTYVQNTGAAFSLFSQHTWLLTRISAVGAAVVVTQLDPPDAAGHDGRPDEKKNGIEQSDALVLGPLCTYAQTHPLRIAVMPDHPTPLTTRKHSYDPVPFVVSGPGIEHNGGSRLTETTAEAAGIMVDPGWKFMADYLLAD
ncbi:MAG: hypothetical protein RRX88_05195, partial [Raoultibacter sp.]